MKIKGKHIAGSLVMVLSVWAGVSSYRYFFDTTTPELLLAGLEDSGFYSGDAQCAVIASKKGTLSVSLDGQPLISKFAIKSAGKEHPFTIPTRTIANGQHKLSLVFEDSAYRRNRSSIDCAFNVDNSPLQAAFVKSDSGYRVLQGRTLHVQFQVNKPIKQADAKILSGNYRCVPESAGSLIYECFVPIECEEQVNEYPFSIEMADHVGNKVVLDNKLQVVMFPFKKEVLHLSAEKVKTEKEIGIPDKEFEAIMAELATKSPTEKMWRGNFCAPIDIARITCDFGTVRTTQEKGRYAHKAIDAINAPRSVVWAPQAGVVALKDRYVSTGNTVVIDHGCGVLSFVCHLENFSDIQVGEKVAQGKPLGTLGKTGYATGYHLHWEMRVNNVPVDPIQWTKVTF